MRLPSKFAAVLLSLISLESFAGADYKDDIGYTALQVELGDMSLTMPTGSGVTVSQIEADGDGVAGSPYAYMPNTAAAQFSADNITNVSGASSTVSNHSTTVGGLIYGSNAIASGVSDIDVYFANNWLGSDFLYYADSSSSASPTRFTAPSVDANDIQNHSWVGTTGIGTQDTIILNRLDYAIQRDDFVAVVGVNNGTGNERNLLASAYNVISVGKTDGSHSYGDTIINGVGRAVPHLVAPLSTTSDATAVVSSASALMIEVARSNADANGEKSETVKAVLLAGATKGEFVTWSNSTTQPLDAVYGAGELNVQNSYHIMDAGEQNASGSTDVSSTGWDYGTVHSSSSQIYYLELVSDASISIALNWNANLQPYDAPGPVPADYDNMILSLANLNLQLYEADGYTLGAMVNESVSSMDNVEYIWEAFLAAGRYAIEVNSDSSTFWDYAVAWQAVAIPEPSSYWMLVAGLLFIVSFISRKSLCR